MGAHNAVEKAYQGKKYILLDEIWVFLKKAHKPISLGLKKKLPFNPTKVGSSHLLALACFLFDKILMETHCANGKTCV